jgi:transposase
MIQYTEDEYLYVSLKQKHMHYKEKISREQFIMISYDTMITPDNAVRLIDLVCKRFFKDHPFIEQWKGNKNEGRKSYPPDSMLKMLVYGYFNGIASSRKLERESYRNIEMIWLMEGLQPDHWTICDFRRGCEAIMKDLLKYFRSFLLDGGFASMQKVAIDGTRVKAYASREMLTTERIDEKLENIDKSISEYLTKLENNDNHDDELESAKTEIEELKEKIRKLELSKSELEGARSAIKESGQKYYAPNDEEAVLLKGRDGKFPGYNAQVCVETKGHFIMNDYVTTDYNDMRQLKESVESVTKETGICPTEILADKGYSNITQILEVEDDGVTQCYIPLIETAREKSEKEGIWFAYDKNSNTYTCVQGKKLVMIARNIKHSGAYYNIFKCLECDGCQVKNKCTRSKTGRAIKRNVDQERIDQYKERITGSYAKERIRERKQVVEHPFGTIKILMGKFSFLLRGKIKAQIEFDLYVTAYNLKRLINCAPMSELINKIDKTQLLIT